MTINNPSIQQQAIFEAICDRSVKAILCIATAGAGKTSTLVHAMGLVQGRIAFAAFNRKIVKACQDKTKRPLTFINTFHGHARSALLNICPKSILNENKQQEINKTLEIDPVLVGFVSKLSRLAKLRAAGIDFRLTDKSAYNEIVEHYSLDLELADVNGDMPANVDQLIDQGICLTIKSLRLALELRFESYDYNDQLWIPCVLNARFWQYPYVFVDEAQDSNPIFRVIARRLLQIGGTIVFVGDPKQAINGFAGADNNALDLIKEQFGCKVSPLTVSYRCSKAVVRRASDWSDLIQAAESAEEGSNTTISEAAFLQSDFSAQDAILCRNTRPLVELAYTLIAKGIACHVEGREIGKGLIDLARRWKRVKSLVVLSEKLIDFKDKQVTKLLAAGKEVAADCLTDKVDTLQVIIKTLPATASVEDLAAKISNLFQDDAPTLTLSTIHKSKGREWDRVYWYGANLFQPSPFARQAWQQDQEDNLCFVAASRAKSDLIEVIAVRKEK